MAGPFVPRCWISTRLSCELSCPRARGSTRSGTASLRTRALLPAGTRVNLKLELFQHTGSFKARGALNNLLALDEAARGRGVTAVSAGNHAIAVAWAAREVGSHAKVVMFKSANPARIEKVRRYGGEVVVVQDVAAAFDEAKRIEAHEGRTLVHPFEGWRTIMRLA